MISVASLCRFLQKFVELADLDETVAINGESKDAKTEEMEGIEADTATFVQLSNYSAKWAKIKVYCTWFKKSLFASWPWLWQSFFKIEIWLMVTDLCWVDVVFSLK